MNKKGFTLVEVLMAMTILILLSALIIPAINGSLKNAREGAYNKQIETIQSAAKKWGTQNDSKLPDIGSTSVITIDFETLIDEGYLKDKKIINPKTEEALVGCVKVSYDNEYNQYQYKYTDNVSDCEKYNVNNL